jgi:hypothetical protein
MSIQEQDKTRNGTATRIRQIREAFTDARNKAGLKDAPEELLAGFDETEFDEIIP